MNTPICYVNGALDKTQRLRRQRMGSPRAMHEFNRMSSKIWETDQWPLVVLPQRGRSEHRCRREVVHYIHCDHKWQFEEHPTSARAWLPREFSRSDAQSKPLQSAQSALFSSALIGARV